MSVCSLQKPLSNEEVRAFLPHRFPFLFVDKILEIQPPAGARPIDLKKIEAHSFRDCVGTRVVGLKNVTYSEPFFPGHFPARAIMPGVLIIETMAQVASFSLYPWAVHELGEFGAGFQCLLVGVNEARFRRPVAPGDTLRVETEVTRLRGSLWIFSCGAFVEDQKVAEAEVLANLIL